MEQRTCSECGGTLAGVEYVHGHPERYDGISEVVCMACGARWGRWTGNRLKEGEYEPRGGARRQKWPFK